MKNRRIIYPSRREFVKSASAAVLGIGFLPFNEAHGNPSGENDKKDGNLLAAGDKKSSGTGFIFDDQYIRHMLHSGHPESPERLKAILRRMKESGLDKKVVHLKPAGDPLEYIKAVHSDAHIAAITRQALDASICRLAVSGVVTAVDAVCQGKVRNAFCALRPPGHHAENRGEAGFCFFNNVAVAARYAQMKYKLQKILIVDWDYHHGNGTEWAFYDDPSVLFFSTHALRAYPGTGSPDKKGQGRGFGYNINAPLPKGADDRTILDAFKTKLLPDASRFKPDLVIISAGFDSRKDDLLGNFRVTDRGFSDLTKLMMAIAKKYAGSRIVSALEGGYNVEGLALAVESHIKALLSA